MTSAAERVGAGLAAGPAGPPDPVRRADPRRRGCRGGCQRRRAPRGACRRRRQRLRPGRAVAVHARPRGARDRRRARTRGDPRHGRTAPGPPGRHEGADRDRSRTNPSSSPRATPAIPVEPWQQVVADAAVGRTLVGVAGTHGKSTTSGWLVHVLVVGRRRPVGVRRRAAAGVDHRRPAGHRSLGARGRVRRRGRRVRRQLRSLPARPRDPDQRRMGPPRRLRRPGCGRRRPSRRGCAARPQGATVVANVGDQGVEAVLDRLTDWHGTIVAYALVDQAPQRLGGYARAIARPLRDGRRTGDGTARPGDRERPGRHDRRGPRARPAGRAADRPARDRGPPQRGERPGGRRCRLGPWRRAGGHRDAPRHVQRHRPTSRADGGGCRRRRLRRLRASPDGHPRDPGGRPPA